MEWPGVSRTCHKYSAYCPIMKTEEILLREGEEKNRIEAFAEHWPWLVPGDEADYEIVTLFEGKILKDRTVIPEEGFANPLLSISG